jgi:hypothetical protein
MPHHGERREQLEMLKHHADASAQLRQVGLAVADGNAGDRDGASLKRLEPIAHLMSVDLPEPDGPHTTTTSPLATSVEQCFRT